MADFENLKTCLGGFTLQKRKDKVPLNDYQRAAIKAWVMPTSSFSAKCDHCGSMYSSGYLALCSVNVESFCGTNPDKWKQPEPRGYSDEELGYYFGWTRDEL